MIDGNEKKIPVPAGCFLPMNAVAIHPQGKIHFCLVSRVAGADTLAALEGERKAAHEQLLTGNFPLACRSCQNKESRGEPSRRTRTWERKIKLYGRAGALEKFRGRHTSRLRHLEISFSNVCNLSCAMCSSEFSSGWFRGDAAAEKNGLTFREFTRPFRRVVKAREAVMEELLARAEEFDLVIIKGGEPSREPLCLNFLHGLGEKRCDSLPAIFIQTNGTRAPEDWIPPGKNLWLDVGVSLDGWDKTYEWVRGVSFEKTLANFFKLNENQSVRSLSLDFTLTAFNCFQLPTFLKNALALRERVAKLETCSVFQWAQQPYASPLALKKEDRMRLREEIQPTLKEGGDFFQNSANLLFTLTRPQNSEPQVAQLRSWLNHLNEMRGFNIEELHPEIIDSLGGIIPVSVSLARGKSGGAVAQVT